MDLQEVGGGRLARMGEDRGVHGVLVGKPEGMRPLGRPRRRWEDNIKMDLQEVGGGRLARMGEDRGVHGVFVGKPEGKRPLGRPRRRWEDNIKMDLQEVGGGRGDWMELAQDRDGWWHLWVR